MKKYKLTKESKEVFGNKVYRIQAIKDFTCINGREVKKSYLGGWVQSEDNLSQDGLCWLFDEAVGMENSKRTENSIGSGNSQQSGNSRQSGNSKLSSGYCFAYKQKNWNITEIDMGDGGICLVEDYKEEKENLSGKTVSVFIDGKEYEAVIK